MNRNVSNGNVASIIANFINQNVIDTMSSLAGGLAKMFKTPPEKLMPSKNNATEIKPQYQQEWHGYFIQKHFFAPLPQSAS
ncbi:hypothetical protein [Sphingobium yanoikuyae]|uniref:Uncharacterized protein n=1 Tax=Sphingobium yanoikuyae TaxID=13690 RepID=A0A9X7YBC3_SPHYA|nr:hypothetical protein [Sphingobium yanoikuyae]QNG44335.1 hypothetical protein H3V42_21000 [Sphingobium yanoikuyae]